MIEIIKLGEDISEALLLRDTVFTIEQGYKPEDDIDGLDDKADHYILKLDGEPIGVTRVYTTANFHKIERVAILKEHRGKGYGNNLIKHILAQYKDKEFILGSQLHAIPFYEQLGFKKYGEEFLDCGQPHIMMKYKKLIS